MIDKIKSRQNLKKSPHFLTEKFYGNKIQRNRNKNDFGRQLCIPFLF